MKYLLFLMFSSMESFSIVLLGLILFRMRLKASLFIKCSGVGFLLATISLILELVGLSTISPLVQLILIIFLIKFLFNVGYIRSILMTVSSYLLFAVIQALFVLITSYYNLISFSEIQPFSAKGHVVQLVTFLIIISVSVIIKKTNEGYSFIPEETDESEKKLKYTNKLLIFVTSVSLVLVSSMFVELKFSNLYQSLMIFFILTSVTSFILLYVTLKRDKEQSEF